MLWRCYYVKHGNHVHCRLFCGPIEGALGLCGKITFRHHEFTEFTQIHKVLPIDFRRELEKGDDDIEFYKY